MAKYSFPAIFEPEEKGVSVYFPDVKGCYTSGKTIQEAISMAKDALCLMLYALEQEHLPIPSPRMLESIKDILKSGQLVSIIECDTKFYEDFYKQS